MYYKILKRLEVGVNKQNKKPCYNEFYRVQWKRHIFSKWEDVHTKRVSGDLSPIYPEEYSSLEEAETILDNKRIHNELIPKEKWASIKIFRNHRQLSNKKLKNA